MKFLLRCLLMLAIVGVVGVVLYYAVQALPASPSNPPPGTALRPEGGRDNPAIPRQARPEGNRGGGIRLRSLFQIGSRVLLFSVLVFLAYLGKKFVFDRKTNKKNTTD